MSPGSSIEEIAVGLAEGTVVPYLGPGVFRGVAAPFPAGPRDLVDWFAARVSVPGRLRGHPTATAQYIESFKHRKTLVRLMTEAFTLEAPPALVHRFLAALPHLPLIVDTWYDGTLARALSGDGERGRAICQVSGVSRAERPDQWFRSARCGGSRDAAEANDAAEAADTVLYKPHGSVYPEPGFLVSDADYVEVLTEIDIQTPIPPVVRRLRSGRRFLFLGCRFNHQLGRIFARQIMKRSSSRHWAPLEEEPTRNEARFLAEQNIVRIRGGLEACIAELARRLVVAPERAEEALRCGFA